MPLRAQHPREHIRIDVPAAEAMAAPTPSHSDDIICIFGTDYLSSLSGNFHA